MRRTPLKRTSRLKQVSAKRAGQRDEHAAWVDAVLLRDRWECKVAALVPEVECGGRIDPHHIAPKGRYPELRFVVSNGVAACRRHHDWIHMQEPKQARELGLLA